MKHGMLRPDIRAKQASTKYSSAKQIWCEMRRIALKQHGLIISLKLPSHAMVKSLFE